MRDHCGVQILSSRSTKDCRIQVDRRPRQKKSESEDTGPGSGALLRPLPAQHRPCLGPSRTVQGPSAASRWRGFPLSCAGVS
jgi:hypothetical protein